MPRPFAALAAAFLFFSLPAMAQEAGSTAQEKTGTVENQKQNKEAVAPQKNFSDEIDAKTAEAIRQAVEKAKDEIRDEVRAEVQGAQSTSEFMGAVAEGPKLQLFEITGYYRTRLEIFNSLDLGGIDASGLPYFPKPLISSSTRSTLSSTNMRLRLEPSLNISESVRIHSQVDVLDNYVYGSNDSALFSSSFSPYPVPFYGGSRVTGTSAPQQDRAPIIPKRVWAEVQTPVGLASFGRMPSGWGLGILTTPGSGLDEDYGDTVDRLQFALPPVPTPLGNLSFIPIIDFDSAGALSPDLRFGPGVGQPFELDSSDTATTFALKIARIDTEDELRRKLDQGEASMNFGLYYNYRSQRNVFPSWAQEGYNATLTQVGQSSVPCGTSGTPPVGCYNHEDSYGHVFDLWSRWKSGRWRIEFEGTGVLGNIGNAYVYGQNSQGNTVAIDYGRVLLRQWGGVLQTEYDLIANKLALNFEVGAASAGNAPGFGTEPSQGVVMTKAGSTFDVTFPPYGSIQGPQFGDFPTTGHEGLFPIRSIRDFQFNPSYRVDYILWREIIGEVTNAVYFRPSVHWNIFPGLKLDEAIIYSMAISSLSTPSSSQSGTGNTAEITSQGKLPLGIEDDLTLTYTSGHGFTTWAGWGILQPLAGMGRELTRGNFLEFGMAATF